VPIRSPASPAPLRSFLFHNFPIAIWESEAARHLPECCPFVALDALSDGARLRQSLFFPYRVSEKQGGRGWRSVAALSASNFSATLLCHRRIPSEKRKKEKDEGKSALDICANYSASGGRFAFVTSFRGFETEWRLPSLPLSALSNAPSMTSRAPALKRIDPRRIKSTMIRIRRIWRFLENTLPLRAISESKSNWDCANRMYPISPSVFDRIKGQVTFLPFLSLSEGNDRRERKTGDRDHEDQSRRR